MHEWAIAENLVRQLAEIKEREKLENISRVSIKLGILRQVVNETLEEAFEMQARGTPAEGTELEIVDIPLKVKCGACGYEREVKNLISSCPVCGNREIEIIAGKELYIDYVEAEKSVIRGQ